MTIQKAEQINQMLIEFLTSANLAKREPAPMRSEQTAVRVNRIWEYCG
jgi:hypothetical protein